jgi:hypothetical protein
MTPTDTAKQLLAHINVPRGSVSVMAEPEPKSGFVLRVWLMPNVSVAEIPAEFLGHPVIVQRTPKISPEH